MRRDDDDPEKHFKKRGNTKFCFLDLCFFSSGVKALQSTTVGPITLIFFSPFYLHFHTKITSSSIQDKTSNNVKWWYYCGFIFSYLIYHPK